VIWWVRYPWDREERRAADALDVVTLLLLAVAWYCCGVFEGPSEP